MLVLDREAVESLLDLDRLVDALEEAMADLSAGQVSLPPRVAAQVPEHEGLLAVMPAYRFRTQTLAVSVYPRNPASGLPSHHALVLVFDPARGSPVALLDGTSLTAARTAAGSALATRLLALPEAEVLTLVGTGVQARAHARAIPRVRALREIRVVGRNPEKAARLAEEISAESRIPARIVPSFQEGAAGSRLICSTTHAVDPVVQGRFLEPGTHINSVGLNPAGRELDDDTVVRSVVFVESREAALTHEPGANDLIWPLQKGVISSEQIHAEIGEVISGKRAGRTSAHQITLYKSVGVAVQDAVAAQLVLSAAQKQGVGRLVRI